MFMTTRRALMAGSALLFAAMPASAQSFLDVGEQEPISILINASPWYGGFEAVVDLYVEQTGNEVAIDATPYNGVLEKARNAIRTSESPYDIINLDQSWNIEFYEQDVLRPLDEVVAGYALPPEVVTCGDSYFWNAEKHFRTQDGGKLMAIPPNCNTHVLVYRSDVVKEVPATWTRSSRPARASRTSPISTASPPAARGARAFTTTSCRCCSPTAARSSPMPRAATTR